MLDVTKQNTCIQLYTMYSASSTAIRRKSDHAFRAWLNSAQCVTTLYYRRSDEQFVECPEMVNQTRRKEALSRNNSALDPLRKVIQSSAVRFVSRFFGYTSRPSRLRSLPA